MIEIKHLLQAFKKISTLNQNIGHTLDVGTIIASYGTRPEHERAGILKNFDLE